LTHAHGVGLEIAGAASGVQSSLQSAFQTLSYAVGIAVPRAEDFTWLMAGSCCVVAAAATLYTSFFHRYNEIAWGDFAAGHHILSPARRRKRHSARLCGCRASCHARMGTIIDWWTVYYILNLSACPRTDQEPLRTSNCL